MREGMEEPVGRAAERVAAAWRAVPAAMVGRLEAVGYGLQEAPARGVVRRGEGGNGDGDGGGVGGRGGWEGGGGE